MLTRNRIHVRSARGAHGVLRTTSALVMLIGASACAADGATTDDEELGVGEVVTEPGELSLGDDVTPELAYSTRPSAQSNAVTFGVSKGERDMRLVPVSTHECFLTRVSGELDDRYSIVALHHSTNDGWDDLEKIYGGHIITDDGDTWKLWTTNGGDNSLSAEATCVPHSDFILDPGMVVWSAKQVYTQSEGYMSGNQTPLWGADAVGSIAALLGDFDGGGESVEVITAPQPDLPSVFRLKNEAGGFLQGGARSFFVGTSGVTVTKRSKAVSSSGNKKTNLIPTKSGVCYLTRFSGDFNGSEERVRIAPVMNDKGVEWWQLETHAGGGKAYATAECIYYNQSVIDRGCGGPCL